MHGVKDDFDAISFDTQISRETLDSHFTSICFDNRKLIKE